MTLHTTTCAVVSFEVDDLVVRGLVAALRTDDRIDVLPVSGPDEEPQRHGCVVFLADARAFSQALACSERWRRCHPGCARVFASVDLEGLQLSSLFAAGVEDFISAPFVAHELLARIQRVLGLTTERPGSAPLQHDPRLRDFIGTSDNFVAQVTRLPMLAACDAGVLILGETGTGKEIFARGIHYLSARASRPWVAVNCGALPTELIENELFGHVKGAYTTAHASRAGLVREAEGGTLFLDDVDCLPLAAQAKLLRFIQEREYRPVGSNGVLRADVRIVAAANERLVRMVEREEFRQDLFYRLNVLTLRMPALRQRAGDIAALARHFMRRFGERHGKRVVSLTPAALERLMAHDWPGNVRELQHAIERAVLLADGPSLDVADLEIGGAEAEKPSDLSFRAAKERVVRQFERNYIERLLASCGGNVTHAARQAGKNRRAFFELMKKHDIASARFRPDATDRASAS